MQRSNAPTTPSPGRWRGSAAVAALLLLGACAPAAVTGGRAPTLEPQVRVGLLVDTTSVELSSATGFSLAASTDGGTVAQFGAGERVVLSTDASGRLRYQPSSAAAPMPTEARLLVARPTAGGTLLIGGKPYRGSALLRPASPGHVTAVNLVDMETYLLGVVPQEIGKVGEELLEAAKAQAVAARTYAMKYMGRRESLGFDVFATVQDQVYGGVAAEHDPVSRAVRATAGEILTYQDEPIEAYYHSTCAGQTAAIDEVWNAAPLPYLVSVVDVDPATGEAYDRSSSRFQWTERWTVPQLTGILNRTLADSLPAGANDIGELRDLRVLARTPSGRVEAMAIVTSVDTFVVGGDRIRWTLATTRGPILNSSKFDVQIVRDAQNRPVEVVATGGGWGHGIGMCQVGAMGRARAGQDYRTILSAYFPNTRLTDLY